MAELKGKEISLSQVVEEKLESPGTENREVERVLSRKKPGESIELDTGEEKTCQLCKIYRSPFNESESIYFQTEDFYIVDTYDRKNHGIRNMAVLKDHGNIPKAEENAEALDHLADVTASHIQEGELIVYGSMNTFTEHFHLIASDIHGEDPEEVDDLGGINSYARFEVEDREASYQPEKSRYRDSFGDCIENWTENTEII